MDSRQGQHTYAKSSARPDRRRQRWLKVVLAATAVLFAAGAGVMLHCAYERRKLLAFDQAVQQVKLAVETAEGQFHIDSDDGDIAFPDLNRIFADGYLENPDGNEYLDGNPAIVRSADQFQAGAFGLFVERIGGEFAQDMVIGYYSQPTWTEVLWTRVNRLFFPPNLGKFSWYEPDWSFGRGPHMLWTGGDCGNCQIWIARGMEPIDVKRKLQEIETRTYDDAGMDGSAVSVEDPSQ